LRAAIREAIDGGPASICTDKLATDLTATHRHQYPDARVPAQKGLLPVSLASIEEPPLNGTFVAAICAPSRSAPGRTRSRGAGERTERHRRSREARHRRRRARQPHAPAHCLQDGRYADRYRDFVNDITTACGAQLDGGERFTRKSRSRSQTHDLQG